MTIFLATITIALAAIAVVPVGSMGQRVLQPIINQQVGNTLAALETEVETAKTAGA